MFIPLNHLLQASGEESGVGQVIIVSLALVGIIVAGFVIVSQVKRRLSRPDEPVSSGFTLSDLRQMHKAGQLTDEEFERAKGKVVEAAQRAAQRAAARQSQVGDARQRDDGVV